jgi:hypothetical protein
MTAQLLDDGHCFREQALELCSVTRVRKSEVTKGRTA